MPTYINHASTDWGLIITLNGDNSAVADDQRGIIELFARFGHNGCILQRHISRRIIMQTLHWRGL